MAKRKPPTKARLKKKLWGLFAEYIKLKASSNGKSCYCYTCDAFLMIGSAGCQAGHFYPKGAYGYLYFHEDNVRPQCVECNLTLMGNTEEFRRRLIIELGADRVDDLHLSRRKSEIRGKVWYREKIEYYSNLVKLLQARLD